MPRNSAKQLHTEKSATGKHIWPFYIQNLIVMLYFLHVVSDLAVATKLPRTGHVEYNSLRQVWNRQNWTAWKSIPFQGIWRAWRFAVTPALLKWQEPNILRNTVKQQANLDEVRVFNVRKWVNVHCILIPHPIYYETGKGLRLKLSPEPDTNAQWLQKVVNYHQHCDCQSLC